MAFALLRFLLMKNNIAFTFEELKEIVKGGYVSIGDYVYPDYKSFRIQKMLNINHELEQIFKTFRLKYDYFDITEITLIPTERNKNGKGNEKRGAFKKKE